MEHGEKHIFPEQLTATIRQLVKEFDRIPAGRKNTLLELADFVRKQIRDGQVAKLNFICTHNSRRSHMAQLWAQAAAYYYGVDGVSCFSGGTEATAFNPRAVSALRKAGFDIRQVSAGDNPSYEVRITSRDPAMSVFSKKYSDPFNPSAGFAAVMTCSHADENCPIVSGAAQRMAIPYDDPKDFDGTPQEAAKYDERTRQIGREMLFAFSTLADRAAG